MEMNILYHIYIFHKMSHLSRNMMKMELDTHGFCMHASFCSC